MNVEVDVAVVGGGPAGLTAARELCRNGVESVLVLDREAQAGGIPRHSDHTGYGIRDLKRMSTGPEYARRLVDLAIDAGADLRTQSMVTGWDGRRMLEVTSPAGRDQVTARAIVLATGARERPRSARRIPGDRPAGVYTTGQLQNLVHLHHRRVGSRAVIVGSELVSWSAVLTLREVGCETALMTTQQPRVEAYAAFSLPGRLGLDVPVARRTRVTRIIGRDRVTAVEIENLDTGARREFPCDTVVLTGDWIPDNELARAGGLEIDPQHLGPVVDMSLRTSRAGVFAAGNLVHPVDTADVAALDGRHVAPQVQRFLTDGGGGVPGLRIRTREPFAWVSPGLIHPDDPAPARGRLLLWPTEYRAVPQVAVSQAGRVVSRRRLPWPLAPGRVFRLPATMLAGADPDGGDLTVHLA